MYAANAYTIRSASDRDVDALDRLTQLDSDPRPMTGRVIIGEIKGEVAAAIAVADGRVVADPFRRTAPLVAHLRRRAAALLAAERTPSLRERMLAGVSRHERIRPRSAGEVA